MHLRSQKRSFIISNRLTRVDDGIGTGDTLGLDKAQYLIRNVLNSHEALQSGPLSYFILQFFGKHVASPVLCAAFSRNSKQREPGNVTVSIRPGETVLTLMFGAAAFASPLAR